MWRKAEAKFTEEGDRLYGHMRMRSTYMEEMLAEVLDVVTTGDVDFNKVMKENFGGYIKYPVDLTPDFVLMRGQSTMVDQILDVNRVEVYIVEVGVSMSDQVTAAHPTCKQSCTAQSPIVCLFHSYFFPIIK